jgi:hypothetical protein
MTLSFSVWVESALGTATTLGHDASHDYVTDAISKSKAGSPDGIMDRLGGQPDNPSQRIVRHVPAGEGENHGVSNF